MFKTEPSPLGGDKAYDWYLDFSLSWKDLGYQRYLRNQ